MNYRNHLGEIADLEEIKNYNENISSAVFWSSPSNTYQDWSGNWRALGDTDPIVPSDNPEVVDGEVCDTFWLDE